jgi:hypothetical protein
LAMSSQSFVREQLIERCLQIFHGRYSVRPL